MLIVPTRTRAPQPEEDKPARGRLPRFGVALFDDSRDSGWAVKVAAPSMAEPVGLRPAL